MSRETTTIELTSKPLKLWLALSGTAFLVSFLGMVYSLGQPDMSAKHWLVATVGALFWHQVCRAARWWQHG